MSRRSAVMSFPLHPDVAVFWGTVLLCAVAVFV
jgi:hypothetical protein